MNRTPESTAINTRYPKDLLNVLRGLAKAHERSLNSEVIWALREYVARERVVDKPGQELTKPKRKV